MLVNKNCVSGTAYPSSAAFNMLSDTLQRFPGIGSGVYLHLDRNSRRAMRLVCKQLRAAIDDAVSGLGISSINRDDPDEVLQRLARTSLRPSKLYLWHYSTMELFSTQTTLFLAALAAREVVPVLHGVQHLTLSLACPLSAALVISLTMPQLRSLDVNCIMDVAACRAWQRLPHLSSLKLALTPASGAAAATPPLKGLEDITSLRSLDLTYSHDMVDEGSLAACTQLTKLIFIECFPALTQLTQLQQLEYVKDLSSDSLPLLATLPQLVNLSLLTSPLQPSSQLSRFLFQYLISLKVESIHSRDLASLDCPQLQTLAVHELLVDCAASLRACASGILQHCSSISVLFTYNHGQEFKEAAAGAGVRQLGPPPSTSALLEALAPWQPRSGKAIEKLGLWRLPDVTHEALKWLPVNIKSLCFQECHLLPGALSSVATRLTQLTCLDLTTSPVASAELQLLVARAQQALTQLTQLQQLGVALDLASDSLPLLATLPQLADLKLQSCPLQISSQLLRFLFQHLTALSVRHIHSCDLAALDGPQLQTLEVRQLLVDCAASLHACASGIMQHCSSLIMMTPDDHESRAAAAGAVVRQLGPAPSASVLLEALAPWQPRSGKAIEELGLWHLSDVTHEALEWLPVNIKPLQLTDCHLLPGALSSVATRLTQLTCLNLPSSPVALVELQLLAAMAKQGASLKVLPVPPSQLTVTLSDACDALSGAAATQLPSLGAHELAVQVEGLSRCQLQGVDSRLFAALGHAVRPMCWRVPSPLAAWPHCWQALPGPGNAMPHWAMQQPGWQRCRLRRHPAVLATLLWALSVIRVVDRQLVDQVAELLLQGPMAGPGLGAGGQTRPGVWAGWCSPSSSLDSCDDLLPRSSAASLLQQLAWVEGDEEEEDEELAEQRSASFTWVLLAWSFARTRYHHHHQLYDKLGEAVLQGLQGSHLMPRLHQASRAAPPHPSSSSSSSVAATHSRSGHGTRSTSPLAGLPPSLSAPPPSPASPLPSNPLARGPPQYSPLPTPLAQLSSTCLVQLLWAFASHEHCQAALLRTAAPVLSARILQGQLSSRRVACVAWAYARLQQLEPRLLSAILRHSMAHAEQYELRYWARLAWAFSTLGLASEEAYHQRLARLMQERQQQLQRPTPAAGAVAAAQRPSRLQQRGRGHTAAPAARPGAGQGPRVGLECADQQDWIERSRAQSQLLP
ncbi:hypothetical protein QJQ45_007490 [Haematococcus lacustris]|nr:hypothetical protein QJQ45_007490 [Haematococcus lacustris]